MPTFRSFDELSRAVTKMARDVDVQNVKTIVTVAKTAQQLATQAASADLGGDPKFSGWAPILDTKIRPTGKSSVFFGPTRSSAGPWTVAEFGRHQKAGPQMVGPRLTKTGRVSRARVKRWNGRTQPKHTASEAKRRIELMFPKVAKPLFVRSMRKTFDVT